MSFRTTFVSVTAALGCSALILGSGSMASAVPVTSGLQFHLDASEGLTIDGSTGRVTDWNSPTGTRGSASQIVEDQMTSTGPLPNPGGFGPRGEDALSFDGSEAELESGQPGPLRGLEPNGMPAPDTNNNMTYFLVFDGTGYLTSQGKGNRALRIRSMPDGSIRAESNWNPGDSTHNWGSSPAGEGVRIASVRHAWDGSTFTASLGMNGMHNDISLGQLPSKFNSIAARALGGQLNRSGFGMQSDGKTPFQFTGDVAEILVYDRALSDQERTQVQQSLTAEHIPEPTSVALLGLGGLALLPRRRRAG